jgi:ATP-dependent helicase/nuclease subunit A
MQEHVTHDACGGLNLFICGSKNFPVHKSGRSYLFLSRIERNNSKNLVHENPELYPTHCPRVVNELNHLHWWKGEARISTIHALCTDLLRERPVEARLDPQFDVLTDAAARRVYRQAFRSWFQRRLEKSPEGLRRFLRRRTRKNATEMLMDAGWDLAEWRDFRTAWQRTPFNREGRIDDLTKQLHEFADLTRAPLNKNNSFYKTTVAARVLSTHIVTSELGRPRDYDDLEATLVNILSDDAYGELRKPKNGPAKFNEEVLQSALQDMHAKWLRDIESFVTAANSDLAALLHVELNESIAEYQVLKSQEGQVDFLDLLIETRNLLVSSLSVRKHFQERYSHVFVDEFQDTDPIQAEILLLLSSDDSLVDDWKSVKPAPGKLFLVADPKQAIYRFRRADIGIYSEVKKLLVRANANSVELTTSFRSIPSIQSAINRAFSSEMKADSDGHQAAYVPLSPFRPEYHSQPSLIALPVPKIYGTSSFSQSAVNECLPDTIAAFVQWLIRESGWTVAKGDQPNDRVPLAANDICILFKRLFDHFNEEDIGRRYAHALEARNVPHLLVGGGRSFYSREEVQTLLTALLAIEWPDDELSVFATLKGSPHQLPPYSSFPRGQSASPPYETTLSHSHLCCWSPCLP